MRSALFALFVTATLLATSCGYSPPVAIESEHFIVYSDYEVCADRAGWLDHTYTSLAEYLGVDHEGGSRIRYFLYSQDQARATCGWTSRCALGDAVFTTQPVDYHEIVHALTRGWGSPPALLREGLAEAIGCGTLTPERTVEPTEQVIAWLGNDQFYAGSREDVLARYPVAQSFVFFLLERFGVAPFSSLCRSVGPQESNERLDEAFVTHLGVGLEEAVGEWRGLGARRLRRVCNPVPLCTAPDISDDSGELRLTCAPGIDPVLDQQGDVRSFAVRSADAATLLRMTSAAETGWMDVSGCVSDLARLSTIDDSLRAAYAEVGVEIVGDRVLVAELDAGRYFASFRSSAEDESTAAVTRGEVTVGYDCLSATTIDVDARMGEVSLYIRGPGVRWVRLRAGASLDLRLVLPHDEAGRRQVSRVEICDSCGGDCVEVLGMEPVFIAAGETVELALYPDSGAALSWAIFLPQPTGT